MEATTLGRYISSNAYFGEGHGARGVVLQRGLAQWALANNPPEIRPFLKPDRLENPADWRDARVGWGIVLADSQSLTTEERVTGSDAPEPIRELIKQRGNAPVFRYGIGGRNSLFYLRDYRNCCDVSIASSPPGLGAGRLPSFLLIYGDPQSIPWSLQFELNAERVVGRIHLAGEGLANYVAAVLSDWADAPATRASTLVWATDHDDDDITHLIKEVIAEPLAARFKADPDITRANVLTGEEATIANLTTDLFEHKPAVIVTTSHGMTGPLNDIALLRSKLGLPIDQKLDVLQPDSVLSRWRPNGAIWYAHACCSAGNDGSTAFAGLVEHESQIGMLLKALEHTGACVSPLPTALLAASRPLRAFVGHVEPTFDWSLRDPLNGQPFGERICRAFYDDLFNDIPIGFALRRQYSQLGSIFAAYDANKRRFNEGHDAVEDMLRNILVARDVQSMVLLGDPAVVLAPSQNSSYQ